MRVSGLVLLVGCGSSSQVGADSPEAPLRELVTASVTGDASAMRHALVSTDRLRKALDCPDASELFRELTGAIENIGEAAQELRDAKPRVEIRSMKLTGQTKIAKGDNFRGCKAAEPFEVRAYSFELRLAALGNADETTDTGQVIRLDGRWYALLKE
jgi:hypothetical protein